MNAERLFDQVGDRAWTLALWITADEASATEAVVAAFTACAKRTGAPVDEACVLHELRTQALARAAEDVQPMGSLSHAVAGMPDAQREAVELSYVGRLTPDAVARVTGRTEREVGFLIREGLRELGAQSLLVAQD